MGLVRSFFAVVARFFLSAIFLASGVNKIFHWHDTERDIVNALAEWQAALSFSEGLHDSMSFLMLWVPALLILGTFLELLGALLLLFGIREKMGAVLLILFLLPTTLLFHEFWFVEGSIRQLQLSLFLRNLAIIGGLLVVSLHGIKAYHNDATHFSSLDFPE